MTPIFQTIRVTNFPYNSRCQTSQGFLSSSLQRRNLCQPPTHGVKPWLQSMKNILVCSVLLLITSDRIGLPFLFGARALKGLSTGLMVRLTSGLAAIGILGQFVLSPWLYESNVPMSEKVPMPRQPQQFAMSINRQPRRTLM